MDLVKELFKKPQFISPVNVLKDLGLQSGMNVIDYASGAGYWSIAAAKLVAPKGKVLAIENDIDMLNLVKSKAELTGISNIEIEEIELEKGTSTLAKPSDLVIVSNILHLISDKKTFASKTIKMVGKEGRLLFIDWCPKKTLFGPPLELRVSEEQVITLFEKNDLHFACTVDAGVDHFGLIFDHKGEGCDWKRSSEE
jgi:ubiquinone/menaquinone biosynthesis C-methylase UbiE